MAVPLKLVLLGGSTAELKELVSGIAAELDQSQIDQGMLAGCVIHRFSASLGKGDQTQRLQFLAASGDSDFRGLYQVLMTNADGVIGLIPTDLARIEESRRVLGPLHQCLHERREKAGDLPFVLQYHQAKGTANQGNEQLDQALGVNPEAVTRVYTQAGAAEQAKGVKALLSKCA